MRPRVAALARVFVLVALAASLAAGAAATARADEPRIVLAPADATVALCDPHTVTATVRGTSGEPLDKETVEFDVVSGPSSANSPGTGSTDSSGQASFTLASCNAGTDTIEASFIDDESGEKLSTTATVTWGHSLSIDDVTVSEGDDAVFTVSISPPLSYSCECSIHVNARTRSTGSAEQPEDYVGREDTLTFHAGDGSGTKTFTVETNADELDEPNETFEVLLSTEDSKAMIADGVGVGTILATVDEEPEPVLKSGTLVSGYGEIGGRDPYNQFSVDGGANWESAWIVPPHGAYSTVGASRWIGVTPDGSGPSVSQYRICFRMPEGFGEATLNVSIHADNAATVALNGVQFGEQPQAAVVANFSDPPESFGTTGPFLEGQNELSFAVRDFGNPTGLDYGATITFLGGPGQGFDGPVPCSAPAARPGSITLDPATAQRPLGDVQHMVTATVRGESGDLLSERDVSFRVSSGPNAGTVGNDSTGSGGQATFTYEGNGGPGIDTIQASFVDDTEATRTATATVQWGHVLSIDHVVVEEGDDAVFTVTILPVIPPFCECMASAPVSVDVATRSVESAHDPDDYSSRSERLTFVTGEHSKTFTVKTVADDIAEPGETFEVFLSNPSDNAVIAAVDGPDGVGVGTILASAAPLPSVPPPGPVVPSISIGDVNVPESGSVITAGFNVRLSEAASRRVTVDYTTVDGSGKAGADYVGARGTLVFEPGELSKTVPVTISDDRSDEPDETFTVRLSNPSNAIIAHGTGTALVRDDADPPPTVSVVDVTVVEGNLVPYAFAAVAADQRFAVFTLGLSEPSGYVVTADYTTADGTARGGTDYTPTSGTATFQPGETTQTVAVPVTPNNNDELDRSFSLRLSGGSNNGGASDGEAQATIQDDDEPPPPVAGQSGNGTVKTGAILIKLPGTDVFVPLTGPVQLPIGTVVDATRGTLILEMSDGAGGTYAGEFSAGIFTILEQTRGVVRKLARSTAPKPKKKTPKKKKQATVLFTTLRLEGGDFGVCDAGRALAAKEKPKPVRRLWGSSKGKFRTKGRHSAATVRGTRWLTSDRCDGTLTYVAQGGPVSVLDFRTGRTIELRQGQTYVAKAPGRRR